MFTEEQMKFFAWAEARRKSRSLSLDAFLARFRSLSLSLPGLDSPTQGCQSGLKTDFLGFYHETVYPYTQ